MINMTAFTERNSLTTELQGRGSKNSKVKSKPWICVHSTHGRFRIFSIFDGFPLFHTVTSFTNFSQRGRRVLGPHKAPGSLILFLTYKFQSVESRKEYSECPSLHCIVFMEISPQDSLSILSALSSRIAQPDLHDILQQSVRRNAVVGHRVSEERSELFSKAALDAVACMCVDKPHGQSVAVSYSHHPDLVYAWVATNSTDGNSTPQALEKYIRSVWDILANAPQVKGLSESPALLLKLSGLVYGRCFRRIYHRVSKFHADFLAILKHARTLDPPPKKEHLDFLEAVQEIIVMLRELCRIDKALPDEIWLSVAKLMTSLYTITSPSAFKIFLAVGFEESETYHNQNESMSRP